MLGLSVAVLAVTGVGAQQNRLDGIFVAGKACEATRKKDRDNPGQVRLVPGKAYELKGRNATPGTHVRIVVPDAPNIQLRWVSMDCGVIDAKQTGKGEGGNIAGGRVPPGLKQNSVEHVLAANWQPGFCRVEPNRPECRSMTAERFDARHFSVHGLWPDDLDDWAIYPCYCNMGQAVSCRQKLGPVKRVVLSDTLRAQLQLAMPGMRSGLHLHEWTKHGTCYERDRPGPDHGATAEEYFSETLAILEQLNRSEVRDLFANNIGKILIAGQVYEAFENAFGPSAGDRVVVRCRKVDGQEVITELWINLGAGITPDSLLSDLMRDAPPASVSSSARRCLRGLVAGAPE